MPARILELKESELCKSGIDDWANYIEYLIAIEVILLIALFAKVSYDYYVFKKTGFLPYPASFIILYNQKWGKNYEFNFDKFVQWSWQEKKNYL